MLSKVLYHINTSLKAKKLLSQLKYENKELEGKNVIIYTLRNLPIPIHIEYFLAYQLAELGANVKIVMDDGVLKHWDLVQIHDKTDKYTLYQYNFLKRIPYLIRGKLAQFPYKHPNIEKIYLSNLLKDEKIENIMLEEKHKWQAESSTRRFFETGMLDLSKLEYKKYYEESLYNCKVSLLSAKKLKEKYNPDLFITSHGIYSLWGPAFYYMKENGVKSFVQGQHAYKIDKLIISNVIAQILSFDEEWKSFSKKNLTKSQREKIITYFESRINFKATDTNIYYGKIKNFKKLSIKNNNEVVFGLFPNIIWDGDIKERDTIFNGVVDWVLKTIDIFKNFPHKLVIRFHPAEVSLWKGSVPLENVIREKIPNIDSLKNIMLISSNEKINTYEFIKDNIDIGLIYDGVLAMEMPYLKKPVIACAISRYTGAGFVYEPQTLEEYINFLKKPQIIIKDFEESFNQKKEELLKYAYWYFFEAGYKFPIFDDKVPLRINYDKLSLKDISIYQNKQFFRTINKFVKALR